MGDYNNKISACLVVYHEEKVIRRCLESLKDVVNEIIIVHDGACKDKTLDICREYTDKIFVREHIGEAEPHRPFSFEKAANDWVFLIDADEYLSNELKQNILSLVDNDNISAYEFLWPIWDGDRHLSKRWPYKRCLFRKSKISYLGLVHYIAEVEGKVKQSDLVLEHRPNYNNYSWKNFKKHLKWAKVQAEQYSKDFKDIAKFNYPGNDWPMKIRLRRKFHIFLAPFEFISTVLNEHSRMSYKEGLFGFKVACMYGVYRMAVDYYLLIEKIKRQKQV